MNHRIVFDLFQRYDFIRRVIDLFSAGKHLQILEVGAVGSPLRKLLNGHTLICLDQVSGNSGLDLRASGFHLPFGDHAFDVVVCTDVLEHVEQGQRLGLLHQLCRVVSQLLILGFPQNIPEVNVADRAFFDFARISTQKEFPNLMEHLKEHLKYGLPDPQWVRTQLEPLMAQILEFENSNVSSWLLLQAAQLTTLDHPELQQASDTLNVLFNRHFNEISHNSPTYRKFFVCFKEPASVAVASDLRKTFQVSAETPADGYAKVSLALAESFGSELEQFKARMEEQLSSAQEQIESQKLLISRLQSQIRNREEYLDLFLKHPVYKAYKFFKKGWSRIAPSVNRSEDHPVNGFEAWMERNRPSESDLQQCRAAQARFEYKPLISVILLVYNSNLEWLEKAIGSVIQQTYENWELWIVNDASTESGLKKLLHRYSRYDKRIKVEHLPKNLGISAASNIAAGKSSGEFILFLDHDDYLSPNVLFALGEKLNRNENLDFIYSDEAVISAEDHVIHIYFRPEFSESFLLSHPYIVHLAAIRRSLFLKVAGFDETMKVSQDYDLFLRLIAEISPSRIAHIPQVLYFWRHHTESLAHQRQAEVMSLSKRSITKYLQQKSLNATVTDGPIFNTFRVRYTVARQPLVSIIVPIRDRIELLKNCLQKLEQQNSYRNFEIIIVNNNSQDQKTFEYLASISKKYLVLDYHDEFNFSKINNFAAARAAGELLLFLNNDTEIILEDSITAMVELFERSKTGIVGAKLLYPDDRIQHAGVIIGLMGSGEHIFRFTDSRFRDTSPEPGYLTSLVSIRDYSAVTAACMMIRASLFHELNGFDEAIKIGYGDIDLCLRARTLGYEVLFSPYAVMYHHESLSRRALGDPQIMEHRDDSIYFRKKWKTLLAEGDPFYNPNLSLHSYHCDPAT